MALAALLFVSCMPGQVIPPAQDDEAKPKASYGYPVEKIKQTNACFDLLIEYPFVGRPEIDQQIRVWVDKAYYDHSEEMQQICASDKDGMDRYRPYIYRVDYELESTPGAISVLFKTYAFTGGAHGVDGLQALNMSVRSGEELRYKDIFADTEGLFTDLSDFVYQSLYPKLGDIWMGSPLFTEGLEPVEASFKTFVITKKGLTIYFPTYQIAPHFEGPQICEVPLEKLIKFKPRPGIWH